MSDSSASVRSVAVPSATTQRAPEPAPSKVLLRLLGILLTIGLCLPAGASELAHPETSGNQRAPDIAVALDETFLVVWENEPTEKIHARLFLANGTPDGDSFVVGTTDNFAPTVAVAALNPGFIIVWDAPDFDLMGQYITSDGTLDGDNFLVGRGYYGAVAANANGDFVVAFNSVVSENTEEVPGATDPDDTILARRFPRNGQGDHVPSDLFQVNQRTNNFQSSPAVALFPNASFVVAWELFCPSNDPCGGGDNSFGVRFRRFNKNGTPATNEIRPHQIADGLQEIADVAVRPDGTFVLSWDGQVSGGSSRSTIWTRAFKANGAPLGPEEAAPTTATGDQFNASLAGNDRGDLLLIWKDSSTELQGRTFDGQLGRLSDELPFSSRSMGERPNVSGVTDRFWVAWSDVLSTGADVYLDSVVVPLFEGGFETQDTSRWSSTTP